MSIQMNKTVNIEIIISQKWNLYIDNFQYYDRYRYVLFMNALIPNKFKPYKIYQTLTTR